MRDTLPISAAIPDPDRHPVDVLAEEFAERIRRGERPSVAEYARLHPDHADELRAALPPIVLMERLKERNRSGSYSMGLGPAIANPPPERLGDFKIVREIGRGGMGIVYEARQESLGGRPVAVKVLARAARLDDQRLERFEREARAAAALHHANIVPVFGVGQVDGVHFIVMQLIDGRPLSEMVRVLAESRKHPGAERGGVGEGASGGKSSAATPSPNVPPLAPSPTLPLSGVRPLSGVPPLSGVRPAVPQGRAYWRWVAEVGRQAAAALDHAHRHGVLHRDVKPGNLIVNDAGEVFVTDFGLAKVGDQATDVTRAGDVIGTLQYLAPEGLRGTTDARGDVYGLGATLYELLTLRPPVEAETPAALMKQLADTDPPPPRKLCPHVPADLETVVLKAIARSPANRYQAAGQLADDLANVLADRPITARRTSAAARAWRWCRRNRLVSSLGAAAAVAAVVALISGWAAFVSTRRALTAESARVIEVDHARQSAEQSRAAAESARKTADAARATAEANVALSLEGFQRIFDAIAPQGDRPPPRPGLPGSRGPLDPDGGPGGGLGPRRFDPADPLGLGRGGPPEGRGPGGPGGRRQAAQEAAVLQSILAFYDQFAGQNQTNAALAAEAAKAYRRVGDSYARMSMSTEADNAYRRSASLYELLLAADPTDEEYRVGWAEAALWIGDRADAQPSAADAAVVARAAAAVEALAGGPFPSPRDADTVARILLRDGQAKRAAGDAGGAERRFRGSAAAWAYASPPPTEGDRPPPPPRPGDPPPGMESDQRHVALMALASLLVEQKHAPEARQALAEAWEVLDRSAARAVGGAGRPPPRGQGDPMDIATNLETLGRAATAAGDPDLAKKAAERAATVRSLRRGPPGRP